MITRAQMPRQLRDKGGIASVTPRENYGLGSKIKDRFRKLIPNELADVAVAAAPFVAPFNPGVAGLMRGIGRFDQRGSISDALKQGALTYGGGQAVRMLGGAGFQKGLGTPGDRFTSPLSDKRSQAIKGLFEKEPKELIDGKEREGSKLIQKGVDTLKEKVPLLENLSDDVAQKLLVGGITSGASALYSYFTGEFEPQEPGETLEEYMARRRESVKLQTRQFMDSYYTPLRNPQYAAMSDEEKDKFIDSIVGQGMAAGGRVGLQQGGIEQRLEQLGGDVSSAEQLLQGINKRLQTAESSLGSGGGGLGTLAGSDQPFNPGNFQPVLPGVGPNVGTLIPQPRPGPFMGRPLPSSLQPINATLPGTLLEAQPLEATGQPIQQPTVLEAKPAEPFDPNKPNLRPFKFQPNVHTGLFHNYDTAEAGYEAAIADAKRMRDEGFKGTTELTGEMGFDRFKNIFDNLNNPNLIQKNYLASLNQDSVVQAQPGSNNLFFGRPVLEMQGQPRPISRGGPGPDQLQTPLQSALGLAKGGMPTGIMRSNQAGVMERDYRDKGGFVPVGIKEKADDVPAMLSKNEFVFTADAVRGAGNGSIEKGAQKMYDTMKNLEKRVT
jgi:hypothetical protein